MGISAVYGSKSHVHEVDFGRSPFLVIWEMTRACALKCRHCRAEAIDQRDPNELTREEAFGLLDEIRRFGKPLVVLTGGDPLRRPDASEIVEYGTKLGLRMTMTPSATKEVTPAILRKLKDGGLARLAVSLDGSTPACHDAFRGVPGAYEQTLQIIQWAHEAGLPVQINTTVTKHNLEEIDSLCELLTTLRIALWSVFFLVPVGRGKLEDEMGGHEYERIFNHMAHLSEHVPFDIKSTEAPHYRRVLVQRMMEEQLPSFAKRRESVSSRSFPGVGRAPIGVNDGKGFVFVSHTGEIYPSGFLPVSAGNVKRNSLVEVYRDSDVFKKIRDYSQLRGKCGACEYKNICGGSRSRAFAVTGDFMAPDPFCVHVPKGYRVSEEETRYW